MQCCISGQVPMDPVISKRSGYLFERGLVEKCILENGLCPISGEPLSVDDLLPVQSNKAVRPRNISSASIPGLLATFQNEWDEVMLEVFTLKQHLDTTRQELSQALYQHDAACRVIARLMRERDEARAILSNGGGVSIPQTSSPGDPDAPERAAAVDPMDVEAAPSTEVITGSTWNDISATISAKTVELSEARRKRPKKGVPAGTRASDTFASLEVTIAATPHKASPTGGVTCLAINGSDNTLLTGGVDKDLHVLSSETGDSLYKVANAHSKKVTCISWVGEQPNQMFLSGSADSTVKLWKPNNSGDSRSSSSGKSSKSSSDGKTGATLAHTYDVHDGAITALCDHPVKNISCSFSEDGTVGVLDLEKLDVVLRIGNSGEFKYLCGAVHPDAIMLGGGTDMGNLKIWDLRQKSLAVNLTDHNPKGVTAVDFSNNGYYVIAGDAVGDIHLWDLRKLKCINKESTNDGGSSAITSAKFDDYGHYAAIAGCGAKGTEIQLWHVKDWQRMATLSNHSKVVNDIEWGPDAQYLASAGADRVVNVYK